MKRLFYCVAGMLMFLTSCEKESLVESTSVTGYYEDNPEIYISDGPVFDVEFNGMYLPVQEKDSVYIFEGDIMIPMEGHGDHKASIRTSGLWENGVVPFVIAGDLISPDRARTAMKHWEEKTNLRFVPRTSEHRDYIYFTNGSGCSSYVGKIGYRQNIVLASGCSIGSAIHEVGHAIGMWHEQSRQDRDNYVKIWMENVQAGAEHNFGKWTQRSKDFGTLDFGSIMMYGSYAFSGNGKPTITRLDGSIYTVQRTALSPADIAAANETYPSATTPVEPTPPPAPVEPDTDGDGLLDKDDKCPTVAGPVANGGCPWPDTDGDGVTDNIDNCPTVVGPASNNGCPIVVEPVEPKPTKPVKERPVRGKPSKENKGKPVHSNSTGRRG